MLRVRDVWANVEVDHLDAVEKGEAMEMRQRTMDIQGQRDFVDVSQWESEASWAVKRTMAELDAFSDSVLACLEKGREIIVLETWGNSNRWEEGRKKMDGDSYCQNEESAGVTAISIQLLQGDGRDISAFVCIAEILEKEMRNRPILPERLKAIIAHPNSTFVGENIAQHFMRLENSFYDHLNGPLYIGLTDLVDRWRRWKMDILTYGSTHSFQGESWGISNSVFRAKRSSKMPSNAAPTGTCPYSGSNNTPTLSRTWRLHLALSRHHWHSIERTISNSP